MCTVSGVGAGCSVALACAQAEGMEPTSPQLLQVWAGACGKLRQNCKEQYIFLEILKVILDIIFKCQQAVPD